MIVKVTFDESWSRTYVIDVDESLVREWLDCDAEHVVSHEDMRRYLDANAYDPEDWLSQIPNLDIDKQQGEHYDDGEAVLDFASIDVTHAKIVGQETDEAAAITTVPVSPELL